MAEDGDAANEARSARTASLRPLNRKRIRAQLARAGETRETRTERAAGPRYLCGTLTF
jgi:hypothetical protein